jgi:hypothetical protein
VLGIGNAANEPCEPPHAASEIAATQENTVKSDLLRNRFIDANPQPRPRLFETSGMGEIVVAGSRIPAATCRRSPEGYGGVVGSQRDQLRRCFELTPTPVVV